MSAVLSDEIVEVKDFTSSGGFAGTAPSSVVDRSPSPGTVVSEVTYDDDKATPKSSGWFWSPAKTKSRDVRSSATDARSALSLQSSDDFSPDMGIGRSSSMLTLAQYRRRQRRKRRKRRRRAIVLFFAFLLLVAATFYWKGAVIVPSLNEMSDGRLADALLPFIDTDTALKYHLTRLPKKEDVAGKNTAKNKKHGSSSRTNEAVTIKTGTATRASSGAYAERKPSELLKEFQTNKKKLTTSISTGDKTSKKNSNNKNKNTVEAGRKATNGVTMKATPRKAKETNNDHGKKTAAALDAEREERRRRRMICNIPFAYIFFRQCWRESRELPLQIDFLLDSMAQ